VKKITTILAVIALLLGTAPAGADEVRYQFDWDFPSGVFSLATFRSVLRGLHEQDILPLRPSAKRVMDGMEWSTNAAAQAEYSGTGVTITSDNANEHEGSYSLKAVIDATDGREFERDLTLNLSAFTSISLWDRTSLKSDEIRFFVEHSSGNNSYCKITTNATADTWQQDTLTLSSPDGNNGTAADLSDIVIYGYQALDASTTYYLDTIKAVVGMTVVVHGTNLGEYYRHVTFGGQPLDVDAQAAPTISVPIGNPRIDILTINSSGTLAWVQGTEASTPTAPWTGVAQNVIPICEVYLRTTMTKVLDYEDKDTDTNQGYILADVRPFLSLGRILVKGADIASASSVTLGNDGNFFDITGTTNITSITANAAGTPVWLQFDDTLTVVDGSNLKLNGDFTSTAGSVLCLISDGINWYEASRPAAGVFLNLTDTPSSYSGQALKYLRVNTTQTGVEFVADPFNTSTGHDHDGSDSKKVLVTNLNPSGLTALQYLRVNSAGTAIEGVADPAHVLGSWSLATENSATQVTTDGFIVVVRTGAPGIARIKTDSSSTPTTIRGYATEYSTATVPVRSGDYYLIDFIDGGVSDFTSYWIPLD
jgi:hypothetical protein